ncbi:hypothetical protein D8I24_0797 [Cupriavidus necator H850]|jgi:hypothetical protein|nr:hypothetical protein D8I24_0797 [Cupriavidus necator H850]
MRGTAREQADGCSEGNQGKTPGKLPDPMLENEGSPFLWMV